MLSFVNDYSEGAHPAILEALLRTNLQQEPGYGDDAFCASARQKIREACEDPSADVFFLAGGTQTNQVVIDTMLAPYEGVVACETGHVSVHEAGAIEYTGHKVLTVPQHEGKMAAAELDEYVSSFYGDDNHEHMVFPGMVYISHPTEYGTLYTLSELEELRHVCDKHGLRLYMDGARLGYGLVTPGTDVTLPDVARLTDAFYIGGTKVGALIGEAVVFPHGGMPRHFLTMVKQHGALLAKGRVLGIQFDTLFTDDLYTRIARNALDCAKVLREAFVERGYEFLVDSPTNQILVVLENDRLRDLEKSVAVSFWEKVDGNHTAVRFATSWATSMDDVLALIELL
ncbi:MAG: aminotransferase class I/II-fold pyridoxal phosphate-dependent enzyme [Atopobiaceae bacterium]|nr:aminotransferase class I/II-fold pyridoxal phosphate-dependent enzyme [Atopobiaceae bacterium]